MLLGVIAAATLALALLDQSHGQATVAPLVARVIGSGGTLIIGENYTLTCQVTGGETTPPTYRWFKDGALLSDQTSGTLTFSPLRKSSSAVYTCEGTRGSLSTTSPSGVDITAVLQELSAVITCIGESYEGHVYSLTCASSGDESLASYSRQFRWDKGGTTGIHREATLVFDPLLYSDRGEYTCTTSFESPYLNGRRAGSETVTVNPVPSGLQVSTSTATSLTITWNVTGFTDRFEVTYSYTVNRSPRRDTISDGSVRSHTLRDLNEDSNYTITVIRVLRNVNSAEATITAGTSMSGTATGKGIHSAVVGIVVVVILAVLVVTAMGLVILVLVIKLRKSDGCFPISILAGRLVTHQVNVGGHDEIHTSLTKTKEENFTLRNCAAYSPVDSTQASNRAEEEKEGGRQYEPIQPNHQV